MKKYKSLFLESGDSFELSFYDNRDQLQGLSPSIHELGKVQYTKFYDDNPVGHETYNSITDAIIHNHGFIRTLNSDALKLYDSMIPRIYKDGWFEKSFDRINQLGFGDDVNMLHDHIYAQPYRPVLSDPRASRLGMGVDIENGRVGIIFTKQPIPLSTQEKYEIMPLNEVALESAIKEYVASNYPGWE